MQHALNSWNSVFLVSFNLHNLHYMCKKWSWLCTIQGASKCAWIKTIKTWANIWSVVEGHVICGNFSSTKGRHFKIHNACLCEHLFLETTTFGFFSWCPIQCILQKNQKIKNWCKYLSIGSPIYWSFNEEWHLHNPIVKERVKWSTLHLLQKRNSTTQANSKEFVFCNASSSSSSISICTKNPFVLVSSSERIPILDHIGAKTHAIKYACKTS